MDCSYPRISESTPPPPRRARARARRRPWSAANPHLKLGHSPSNMTFPSHQSEDPDCYVASLLGPANLSSSLVCYKPFLKQLYVTIAVR